MLTLAEFQQGRRYGSLYKVLYGYRPRDLVWSSPEEFKEDLERLREELDELDLSDDLDSDRDEDTVFIDDYNLEDELGYNPFDDRFEDDWH